MEVADRPERARGRKCVVCAKGSRNDGNAKAHRLDSILTSGIASHGFFVMNAAEVAETVCEGKN